MPTVHHILKRMEIRVDQIDERLAQLNQKADKIMATQSDAAAQLTSINTELAKIATETQGLLDQVAALQAAASAAGNVTPELQSAIDAVAAQAKVVDDLVPDAPAAPTP
jgi:chromosome segregation ATPase